MAIPKIGDAIILPQDFNATCGRVESISDDGTQAVLTDAYDIFGALNRRVRVPLAYARPFPEAPRLLSLIDAYSI